MALQISLAVDQGQGIWEAVYLNKKKNLEHPFMYFVLSAPCSSMGGQLVLVIKLEQKQGLRNATVGEIKPPQHHVRIRD